MQIEDSCEIGRTGHEPVGANINRAVNLLLPSSIALPPSA